MPDSAQKSTILAAEVSSVWPPKVMVPRQIRETVKSVCFRVILSMV